MTVANKFLAENIRYSEETKKVYMSTEHGVRKSFTYTFCCEAISVKVFFDMKQHKLLWLDRMAMLNTCILMDFWVENDKPMLSVTGFIPQESSVLGYISNDFKHKLAAYTLDGIINSD